MSGGVDIKAMDIPKKLFATARAFEEGGSLTIVGTALIDTGSRMDDLIFQEFKGHRQHGTGARSQAGRPPRLAAIDIEQSGTRREEKLLPPRNAACRHDAAAHAIDRCITSMRWSNSPTKLGKFKSNEEFVNLIKGAAVD